MENKKFDKNEALAKIKAKISNFYESVGRGGGEHYDTEEDRIELIEDIDNILNQTSIPVKNLIIEKLSLDNEIKGEIKEEIKKWKRNI